MLTDFLLPFCSFCRKTTLTKHQHRSHKSGLTRASSEDATPEQQTFQPPATTSVPSDQYILAQQPFYPQPTTQSTEFYPQQNVSVAQVPVQESPAVVAQNVPVSSPVETQQYFQLMQPFDPNRTNYMPPEFQQPPYAGPPILDCQPMMVPYHPDFQYKQPTRILDQPEGTDWGFLGVG